MTFNNFLNNPTYSDNVVGLVYHTGAGGDPWAAHSSAHSPRLTYYTVQYVPDLEVDGVILHTSASNMANAYNTRIAIESPIAIDMNANIVGDAIAVNIDITTADEAVTGNNKLRVALIDLVLLDFWTASNGQTDYYWDMVDMYMGATGQACEVPANTTSNFTASFDWPITLNGEELDIDNVKIVAWVQDDGTKEVLNSEWVFPSETNVGLTADGSSALVGAGTAQEFGLEFSNLMEDNDNFNVSIESTLPDGWTLEYTTPTGPETGNSAFALNGNADFNSTVTITTDDTPGVDGMVTFNVTSDLFPSVVGSASFYVNAAGDIVIVDESMASANMSYYTDAMANVTALEGYTSSTWDNGAFELDEADLIAADPSIIVWVGGADGGIAANYITALEGYLENGGNLWITGCTVANDLQGSDLLENFGATYDGHYDVGNHIEGIDGEPYFAAINVDINGGDGADNNNNPAVLGAFDGTACLKLSRRNETAIYKQTDTYNAIIFGFPFESIATAEARNAVMTGVADVLQSESKVPGDQGRSDLPSRFALEQNYPNPFNPTTTISFSLPMTAKVTLQVFNLEGQEVKSLAEGEYSAGHHTVTFNGSDLASGVYIYRMTATGEESFNTSRKMLLIK